MWETDGTVAGTHLLADIVPGPGNSQPTDLTLYDGEAFFEAYDTSGSEHLWASNGVTTQAVTTGNFGESPGGLTVANGYLFFAGYAYVNGVYTPAVFRTDGTTAGTILLQSSEMFGSFYATANRVFWEDLSGAIYSSDGTTAGTTEVLKPNGSLGYIAQSFTPAGNLLFFEAEDAVGNYALWVSDGTVAGTKIVTDNTYVFTPVAVGSLCFFVTSVLWVSNGVSSTQLTGSTIGAPGYLKAFNGKLYFSALDKSAGADGLFVSDGTVSGTKLVAHVTISSQLVVAGDELFFFGADPANNGAAIWKSNGTAAGTVLVADLSSNFDAYSMTAVGSKVFFTASTPTYGDELWVSDGTAAGTGMVKDIDPGALSSSPTNITDFNGKALFSATGPDGTEPWISDGTAAGTFELGNVYPGISDSVQNSSLPSNFLTLPTSDPIVNAPAQPVFSGTGSTVTLSGAYSDNVAVSTIEVFSGATLVGVATLDLAHATWSLSVTLAPGVYNSLTVEIVDVDNVTATTTIPFDVQVGVSGQPYVSIVSSYTSATLVSKSYYRADGSLYLFETYSNGLVVSDTYYGVTGQAYTSYEYVYDASGHYTAETYFGYAGRPYVTIEYDYSWSSTTSSYTLLDVQYLRSNDTLYEKTIYNVDKSYATTYYGVTGQVYTSYEFDYDASGHYTAKKYFGYTGHPYVTIEYDYSWSSTTSSYTLIDIQYLRADNTLYERTVYNADKSYVTTFYGVTGRAYTSYEVDYDASGHYTATKYFGYTGHPYVTIEYDYSWSSTTSSYTLIDVEYLLSGNTLYEKTVYNADKSYVTTYYGVTGQAYTSFEFDYDPSGHYTAKKYFGYTGKPYVTIEYDYSWSSTTSSYTLIDIQYLRADNTLYEKTIYNADKSYATTYYGVTGQAYTSFEFDLRPIRSLHSEEVFWLYGQTLHHD